jgi:hypothetical protein
MYQNPVKTRAKPHENGGEMFQPDGPLPDITTVWEQLKNAKKLQLQAERKVAEQEERLKANAVQIAHLIVLLRQSEIERPITRVK